VSPALAVVGAGGSGASFTGGGRRAPGPGRLSLAVLASISRDCADFERGLLAPLEAAGGGGGGRRTEGARAGIADTSY
jgi:hypothetical protein